MKERAANRAYTPAQEAAQARAADSIKTENRGWWGDFSSAFQGMMDANAGTGAAADDSDAQVGPSRMEAQVCSLP